MKPVDQTTFGVPGGNCFSACVASLLEFPVEAVPYFMGAEDWVAEFSRWLLPRGMYVFRFRIEGAEDTWRPPGFYILSGQSPRGSHSVVALGPDVVHDPHPSRAGLLTQEDLMVLVPIDIARLRGAGG